MLAETDLLNCLESNALLNWKKNYFVNCLSYLQNCVGINFQFLSFNISLTTFHILNARRVSKMSKIVHF